MVNSENYLKKKEKYLRKSKIEKEIFKKGRANKKEEKQKNRLFEKISNIKDIIGHN